MDARACPQNKLPLIPFEVRIVFLLYHCLCLFPMGVIAILLLSSPQASVSKGLEFPVATYISACLLALSLLEHRILFTSFNIVKYYFLFC